MRRIASIALLILAASCGPNHGTAIEQDTPGGKATIYHTENVDATLAGKVLKAMIDGNYNFGDDLAVQVDKVGGRLTLRTCHDNNDTIDEIIKNGEESGAVSYVHGLSWHISKATDNQAVDVVLHRLTLADPFYTVKWQAPPK